MFTMKNQFREMGLIMTEANNSVKVASVAIDVDSSPDGKDVVTRMLQWIDKAAEKGAKLVVFPESSFGTGCT